MVICVSALGAALLTRLCHRLLRSTFWAAACGAAILPFVILAGSFYLESQQPYGPFYALIGAALSSLSLLIGVPAAAWTATDCAHQSYALDPD